MRAPAGERLQLGQVRLDDGGAGLGTQAQRLAVRVQQHRHPGSGRHRDELGVAAGRQPRRQAPGQHHGRAPAQDGRVPDPELRVPVLGDQRAGLIEQGRLPGPAVHHRERPPRLAPHPGEGRGHGQGGELRRHRLTRGPADQAHDEHLGAERVQRAGHVQPLAARPRVHHRRPVHPGPVDGRDLVGHVQGRVQADDSDHVNRLFR